MWFYVRHTIDGHEHAQQGPVGEHQRVPPHLWEDDVVHHYHTATKCRGINVLVFSFLYTSLFNLYLVSRFKSTVIKTHVSFIFIFLNQP